jgi:glyoxylase-like metal-dependent hydrolase (beta-lactamase superfamily II)
VIRGPERFDAGEARLYRIPLELFPGLAGWAHLVLAPDRRSLKQSGREMAVLIDVGSGFGESNEQLAEGLRSVGQVYGERIGWGDLTHVLITHGHIDHYGGLSFVRQYTKAPIGIHALDRSVLTAFEKRLEATAGRLERFLMTSGIEAEERQSLMELYLFTKHLFRAQEVDFVVRAGTSRLGPIEILHTPGHCQGQLVLRIGDVLLTSDHVLPGITPHMAPGSLAKHTGLGEYLRSLDRLGPWAVKARGSGRARTADPQCRRPHRRDPPSSRGAPAPVLKAMESPATIANVADRLFPTASGYHRLLALEKVGAHVEFLQAKRLIRRDPTLPAGAAVAYRARAGDPPTILRTVRPLS